MHAGGCLSLYCFCRVLTSPRISLSLCCVHNQRSSSGVANFVVWASHPSLCLSLHMTGRESPERRLPPQRFRPQSSLHDGSTRSLTQRDDVYLSKAAAAASRQEQVPPMMGAAAPVISDDDDDIVTEAEESVAVATAQRTWISLCVGGAEFDTTLATLMGFDSPAAVADWGTTMLPPRAHCRAAERCQHSTHLAAAARNRFFGYLRIVTSSPELAQRHKTDAVSVDDDTTPAVQAAVEEEVVFIDRDPDSFRYVLSFLRGYPLWVPPHMVDFVADDASYYGVTGLLYSLGIATDSDVGAAQTFVAGPGVSDDGTMATSMSMVAIAGPLAHPAGCASLLGTSPWANIGEVERHPSSSSAPTRPATSHSITFRIDKCEMVALGLVAGVTTSTNCHPTSEAAPRDNGVSQVTLFSGTPDSVCYLMTGQLHVRMQSPTVHDETIERYGNGDFVTFTVNYASNKIHIRKHGAIPISLSFPTPLPPLRFAVYLQGVGSVVIVDTLPPHCLDEGPGNGDEYTDPTPPPDPSLPSHLPDAANLPTGWDPMPHAPGESRIHMASAQRSSFSVRQRNIVPAWGPLHAGEGNPSTQGRQEPLGDAPVIIVTREQVPEMRTTQPGGGLFFAPASLLVHQEDDEVTLEAYARRRSGAVPRGSSGADELRPTYFAPSARELPPLRAGPPPEALPAPLPADDVVELLVRTRDSLERLMAMGRAPPPAAAPSATTTRAAAPLRPTASSSLVSTVPSMPEAWSWRPEPAAERVPNLTRDEPTAMAADRVGSVSRRRRQRSSVDAVVHRRRFQFTDGSVQPPAGADVSVSVETTHRFHVSPASTSPGPARPATRRPVAASVAVDEPSTSRLGAATSLRHLSAVQGDAGRGGGHGASPSPMHSTTSTPAERPESRAGVGSASYAAPSLLRWRRPHRREPSSSDTY